MSRKENAQKYLESMINRYFVGVIENIFEFVIHYAYSTTLQKKNDFRFLVHIFLGIIPCGMTSSH